MFRKIIFIALGCTLPLLGEVENSILPLMEQLQIQDLQGKVSLEHRQEMAKICCFRRQALKIMSFNMLFNVPCSEEQLEPENQWANRCPRLIEYLDYANVDVIGSQELQKNQLDSILCAMKNRYGFYGVGVQDQKDKGDIPGIFYRKERLELLEGKTYYFSETPTEVSAGPYKTKNTFTVCIFHDLLTDQIFQVVNTHLAFGNIERRHYEAQMLKAYLEKQDQTVPLIITGDFNTFPMRQELLGLPFYDGDKVVSTIESGGVEDSARHSIFGHFGPIASTNFCEETKKTFSSLGTPGVILDHVFVNGRVRILSHGTDPAKVN